MNPADLASLLHEARSRSGYRKHFLPLVERTMTAETDLTSSEAGLMTLTLTPEARTMSIRLAAFQPSNEDKARINAVAKAIALNRVYRLHTSVTKKTVPLSKTYVFIGVVPAIPDALLAWSVGGTELHAFDPFLYTFSSELT